METRLIGIETPQLFAAAVRSAAEVLAAGEIVAVPTETVYGLAANALNAEAVEKIYRVKGRPGQNPIIMHVISMEMARECAAVWPECAARLARRFWPGPLTMVLPKTERVPPVVSGGGTTVGIRWPMHPFTQKLIEQCGFPIAAPSANLANQLSPTTAEHVLKSLRGKIPLIIDAGPCSVGLESTVLDLSSDPPRVLRPGIITRAEIEGVIELPVAAEGAGEAVLKSPGLFPKHYAPRAGLRVVRWRDDAELRRLAEATDVPLSHIHVLAHEQIPQANPFGRVAIIPNDAEAYARALYAELHECDALGAKLILVEAPPVAPEWDAIRDRLTRASGEG